MYLLYRGANPKAKNKDGDTIKDIAKRVYDKNLDDGKKKQWGKHQLEIIKDAVKNFKKRMQNGIFRRNEERAKIFRRQGRMSNRARRAEKNAIRKEMEKIEKLAKQDVKSSRILKGVR